MSLIIEVAVMSVFSQRELWHMVTEEQQSPETWASTTLKTKWVNILSGTHMLIISVSRRLSNECVCFLFQYGNRALEKITKAILGHIESKVAPPKDYPGGDAMFFRGKPGLYVCLDSVCVCV